MARIFVFVTIVVSVCTAVWAQAPAQAPAGPPSPRAPGAVSAGFDGSAYAKARDIPARIVDFTVAPASIKAGQSVTMVWHTENPTSVTIDPEPGRVTPRGSRQITPSATTTYTLTALGPNNQVLTKTVTVTVAGGAASARADSAAKKAVPQFPDGKPDLSGVYGAGGGAGAAGGRGAAAAAAGPVLKAGAEKFRIARAADDTGATSNCMPLVPPQSWGVPYQFQILQGRELRGDFSRIPRDLPDHSDGWQPARRRP